MINTKSPYTRDYIIYQDTDFSITDKVNKLSNSWLSKKGYNDNLTKRENFGFFMSTIIRELCPIFYYNSNDLNKILKEIKKSEYKDEALIFLDICSILGLSLDEVAKEILFKYNNDNNIRNSINERFTTITKNKKFWPSLEKTLDLIIAERNNKNFKQSHINRCLKHLEYGRQYFIINGQIENKKRILK